MSASPRTSAEPAAFTGPEFVSGAATACLLAMAVTLLAWTAVFLPMGAIGIVYIVPTAVAATILGSGPAWMLARAVRRVRHRFVHVAAFAVLGALVGFGATVGFFATLYGGVSTSSGPGPDAWVYIINAVCGGLAVALGRYRVARRAARADAGVPPTRLHVDPDARAEDAAVVRIESGR